MINKSHTQLYKTGDAFYFGTYDELNPNKIVCCTDAAKYYKAAYEKLLQQTANVPNAPRKKE